MKLEKMKGPHREMATPSKIKFEDSEEESGSSSSSAEDEEEIERELAEVTFEELQKARSDGSHSVFRNKKVEKKTGRANKNRPMEVSCKKPVGIFRETIQVPKKIIRDPRFEDPSGTLDVDGHRKRYNFLYSEKLPAEKEELHKQLKKTSDPKVVNKLKGQLSWIDKQLKSQAGKPTGTAVLADHKKKEREAAKQGKRPYYLKKSEIREKTLVEKYNDLKASGKLESFMEKRRRKNAAKDHRFVPYRRPNNEQQSQ